MTLKRKRDPVLAQTTLLPEREAKHLTKKITRPRDHYTVETKIGSGGFSSVYKVICKATGLARAMKVVKLNELDEEEVFLKEIKVLAKVSHPNIVKVFEYFTDSQNCYIITEFVEGGELYDTIANWTDFSEVKAVSIMNQLLSAVFYLHSLKIVHRDLKPENILVEKKKSDEILIKLIDFGTCSYLPKGKYLSQTVGTAYYIAPEVLKGKYTELCDIWSCGVIMFVLLAGYPPFRGEETEEIFKNIKKAKFSIEEEEWEFISQEAKDLVKAMLTKKQENRPSAEICLKSEWLKKKKEPEIKEKALKSVLRNMKMFKLKANLQKSAISYIVHFFKSSAEAEDLREIFIAMDTNGDGKLTYKELREGFKEVLGEELTEIEFSRLISKIDGNSDKVIEYEEFLRIGLNEKQVLNEEKLKLAFRQFDANKDGVLSVDELKRALQNSKNAFIKEIIAEIKRKKVKELSFYGFVSLVKYVVTSSINKGRTVSPLGMRKLTGLRSDKLMNHIFSVRNVRDDVGSISFSSNGIDSD